MALRLLLDEDTERELAAKLSKAGHDIERVVAVTTLGSGTSDTEICEYSLATERIIITHDKDYLEFSSDSHAGVFFVPDQRLSAHRLFTIIQAVERAHTSADDLASVIFLTEQWVTQ